MADNTIIDTFRGLKFSQLISSPLLAIVNANSQMARRQIELIFNHCFTKNGDTMDPTMVKLSMKQTFLEPGNEPGQAPELRFSETVIQIPLLTLIPINSLSVQDAKIHFGMEVTYSEPPKGSEDGDKTSPALFGHIAPGPPVEDDSRRKGRRHRQGSSERNSEIRIDMQIEPLPLTTGLKTILDAYNKSILPVEKPNSDPSSPPN